MPQIPGVRSVRTTLFAFGLTTTLAVSACSGGTAAAPATSAPTPASSVAESSTAGGPPAQGVADYLSYVGGTAGAADPGKSPIGIGWVNVEGGAIGPSPEATHAAQAAVKFVNDNLGGIGGHPLALQVCTISAAEEEGQKCGQQLLNDASVKALAFGNVFMGDTSFNSVIAGQKPLLVGVADGP